MPRKAMPELALLVQRFPDTPQAKAARQELEEMRQMLEREREQMIPFTVQFLQQVGRGSVGDAAGQAVRELERHMVREALAACGGDKAQAAERLGVSLDELEAKLA